MNNQNGVAPDFLAGAPEPEKAQAGNSTGLTEVNGKQPYVPKTEKKQPGIKRKLGEWVTGGIVVVLALLFALSRIPHGKTTRPTNSPLSGNQNTAQSTTTQSGGESSILPITDAARPQGPPEERTLGGEDIARTARQRQQTSTATNLSGITPFNNNQQPWEAPPYQPNAPAAALEQTPETSTEASETKNERDGLDKPSLVFVKSAQSGVSGARAQDSSAALDLGIGLPPGTRLRARLESAVSTAVATPVVAVVEYNYERHGEIVIPAGAKVFGHLEAADGSGYVGVRFDSVMMPDGSSVNLEAAATDLQLRPLRGKVEGRHRGKNILVRSASGIGEIAATIAGRGSLNQSLSEGDLLRERVSNNIAQASDEQVNKLAVTEHLVVSVPANTEIYVVLQKPAKTEPLLKSDGATPAAQSGGSSTRQNAEQLRQLLQLQKELNQEANAATSNQ
ncbi:MAG TPA: TrbI/VirB10 family protein [Candidatus Angelobacter sp.]|nr:TrbI/VirB10 family protein [Candidatus Angelobacter sp.]